MEPPPPPNPNLNPNSPFASSEMNFGFPPVDDSDSTALFDWGDFLDFAADDSFAIPSPSPFGSVGVVEQSPSASAAADDGVNVNGGGGGGDRVRKRDPKLTCENYLAGIVPCACPEMDALLAEEEELRGTGKKRARTVKAGAVAAGIGVLLRCQVVGCEVDISDLKGYHKRHRVCLKCANAGGILIDGETKRYCQQCGK